MASKKIEPKKEEIPSLSDLFITKKAYLNIADEFHPFHQHDMNVFFHVLTSGLGIWGVVQLALLFDCEVAVYAYTAIIALTTPFMTGVLHTLMMFAFAKMDAFQIDALPPIPIFHSLDTFTTSFIVSVLSIALGYGLQDVSHWIFMEKTYMESYIGAKPWKLVIHSIWLMPLVIDSVLKRHFFLPHVVTRNTNIDEMVASKDAVDTLRKWVKENIAEVKETTHVWPHERPETSGPVKKLEDDSALHAGFRKVYAAKHFDVRPIQGMNEIYITAVGAKKQVTSDTIFYTSHVDGPYFWLPFSACYRCLVGVTPNKMVRTSFNLQHESQNKILNLYQVIGFDYNRELHYIDHVDGVKNDERRSVIKLHYVVYPKGWHWYGDLVAHLNTSYNTWARGNFLKTLRPSNLYERGMAWWIWLTTIFNAVFEEYFGWYNLFYIAFAFALGPTPFLILTSFRHYVVYMTTFAYREPPVAHGYLMRDAKLFKTTALIHLGLRLLPLVKLPRDIPGVLLACLGFGITIMATSRLGFVRTYFGSELGFVEPKWIEGFPYGYIAHPMIVGQLFAYSSILYWFRAELPIETVALIATHMSFYTAHMVQEMLYSSY